MPDAPVTALVSAVSDLAAQAAGDAGLSLPQAVQVAAAVAQRKDEYLLGDAPLDTFNPEEEVPAGNPFVNASYYPVADSEWGEEAPVIDFLTGEEDRPAVDQVWFGDLPLVVGREGQEGKISPIIMAVGIGLAAVLLLRKK